MSRIEEATILKNSVPQKEISRNKKKVKAMFTATSPSIYKLSMREL